MGLVCMTSLPKYVFSLHSASFLPSLSCLSPCVFVCLFHSVFVLRFLRLLMFEYGFCSCYFVLHVALHPSERGCMCVYTAEMCVFFCLQVFEAVAPGGSHCVSACPLQVGRQSDIGGYQTHSISIWLGKVFAETNLTKMCTLQIVLK